MSVVKRSAESKSERARKWIPWDLLVWVGYIVLFLVYAAIRGLGDECLPVHKIGSLEERIFGGIATLEMQKQLHYSGERYLGSIGWLFHGSWFAMPFVGASIVILIQRERLMEFLGWVLATSYFGAAIYLLVPVEPPWMEVGATRILHDEGFFSGMDADPNPVAAFPSLHAALPMVIAYFMWKRLESIRWALVFVLWGIGISVSVVYLGEHWVLDVVGAYVMALTTGRMLTSRRLGRWARSLPGDPAGLLVRVNGIAFPPRERPVVLVDFSSRRRNRAA